MSQHLAGPDPDQTLSDDVIAFLRTFVPILWGSIASWLINLGVPATVIVSVHSVAVVGLTALCSTAWYLLWRWASPRIPPWIVVLALGYAADPIYNPIPTERGEPTIPPQRAE
jgi:hypothetical protein